MAGVKVDLMSSSGPGPRGDSLLAIGELAERTGKRPSSIRYYEQIDEGRLPVRSASSPMASSESPRVRDRNLTSSRL